MPVVYANSKKMITIKSLLPVLLKLIMHHLQMPVI